MVQVWDTGNLHGIGVLADTGRIQGWEGAVSCVLIGTLVGCVTFSEIALVDGVRPLTRGHTRLAWFWFLGGVGEHLPSGRAESGREEMVGWGVGSEPAW